MNKYLSYLSPRFYSSFVYQTIFITITTFFTILFLYQWTDDFFPLERSSEVVPITPDTIKKWSTDPVHIQTGMTVTQILKFDTLKNDFLITAIVWFVFDPTKIAVETIDKFSFIKGVIKEKTPNYTKIDDHTTLAEYYITLKFYETMNYSRFPLDDHYINLRLTNEYLSPREFVFDSSKENFIYVKTIYLPGFEICNLQVKSGFREWPIEFSDKVIQKEQVVVNFGIGLNVNSMRHVLLIIIPLLFLFFVGLLSFAIESFSEILTLSSASIAGFIAYSYVIESLSPEVAPFLISDYLLFFFFSMGFVIFLLNMIFFQQRENIGAERVLTIKGITLLIMHVSFIVLFYYFVFHYQTANPEMSGTKISVTNS